MSAFEVAVVSQQDLEELLGMLVQGGGMFIRRAREAAAVALEQKAQGKWVVFEAVGLGQESHYPGVLVSFKRLLKLLKLFFRETLVQIQQGN